MKHFAQAMKQLIKAPEEKTIHLGKVVGLASGTGFGCIQTEDNQEILFEGRYLSLNQVVVFDTELVKSRFLRAVNIQTKNDVLEAIYYHSEYYPKETSKMNDLVTKYQLLAKIDKSEVAIYSAKKGLALVKSLK